MKTSIAKNQLIFSKRCIKNNLFNNIFHRLKPRIKSIKSYNITKDFRKKLVALAKNNAKQQRMYSRSKKVEEIKLHLKNILSREHYILIQNVIDNSREKVI